MTTASRIGLELASIASVLLCGWLVSVILLVMPEHDPSGRPFWAGVAVVALALAAASFRAVGTGAERLRPRLLLAVLSPLGFGLGVATAAGAMRPSAEGYLVVIAAILLANGAFGLSWLIATARRPR